MLTPRSQLLNEWRNQLSPPEPSTTQLKREKQTNLCTFGSFTLSLFPVSLSSRLLYFDCSSEPVCLRSVRLTVLGQGCAVLALFSHLAASTKHSGFLSGRWSWILGTMQQSSNRCLALVFPLAWFIVLLECNLCSEGWIPFPVQGQSQSQ